MATRRLLPALMVFGILMSTLLAANPAGASAPPTTPTTFVSYPPVLHRMPQQSFSCSGPATGPPIPADKIATIEFLLRLFTGSYWQGGGECGQGHIDVLLGTGAEQMAARVHKAFGPSVVIFIDNLPWTGKLLRSDTCGDLPKPTTPAPGYTSTLQLHSTTVKQDANFTGRVVFRNTSNHFVRVLTGQPEVAVLVKPGTRRVVGLYTDAVAGTGYGPGLNPGQTNTTGLLGGTARCDGGLGTALPPGRYDVVAEISGPAIDGAAPPIPPLTFTNFVPIRIVKR